MSGFPFKPELCKASLDIIALAGERDLLTSQKNFLLQHHEKMADMRKRKRLGELAACTFRPKNRDEGEKKWELASRSVGQRVHGGSLAPVEGPDRRAAQHRAAHHGGPGAGPPPHKPLVVSTLIRDFSDTRL